ncbi:MAG TPA: GNAT family N-acetyltransferase [Vicinamibacterales bacterium]|nr:GNAT family N-acetyltransferase [Vicinamibacterales bacterium]
MIRRAGAAEAEALARFAERTFREAFEADNRPEDMDAYCATAFAPEIMRGYLSDPSVTTLVIVAEDGAFAAYAQLRPEAPGQDADLPQPFELWRFYVDKVHHGRGIAHQLMDATIAAARERGAGTLWLGVWERNTRAEAFYRKFGFVVVGSHTFVLGTDVQTDRLMARRIGGRDR